MMNKIKSVTAKLILWSVCLVLVGGGCATLPPLPEALPQKAPSVSLPEPADISYVIGPGDGLKITVYGHEDLTNDVVVSSEGLFTYPLLGEIEAAGLTPQQLQQNLTVSFSKLLVKPQVNVTVTQFESQRVNVLGEVENPGSYGLKGAAPLQEMIARAGGVTPDTGWQAIVVRGRREQGNGAQGLDKADTVEKTIRVDLEQLLSGQIAHPIMVHHGDTVYVPAAAFFYVSGEVENPGRYRLERDVTVTKALTMAGGMTRFAAKKRLVIRRLIDGKRQEFRVSPTDLLQADDVLIIPQSVF